MHVSKDLLLDEIMIKRFEKDKETIRFYYVKLGTPCEWVAIKLENLQEYSENV